MITPATPSPAQNVLGEPLQTCSTDPMTGYTRTGCCVDRDDDPGQHTVCAVMTAEFLAYTAAAGNDLSTPRPEFRFPGLQPGDRWCLCVGRWKEALDAGCAPRVVLQATHAAALDVVTREDLLAHTA
ncbi:MAG: DUF2237 domain-containing protein, partial [Planctomycetota bacterium]